MDNNARAWATPPGVALGPLHQIVDGAARGFVLQLRAGRFHGFVVRRGDQAFGYVDRCPHVGALLPAALDEYLTPDGCLIACAWHGALFRIEDGLCVGGPCKGQRLAAWPIEVVGGELLTA